MTQYIPVFGLRAHIVASTTFPAGFGITQFASDADPIDFPTLTMGDAAMGVNGDMEAWSVAAVIKATINVISGSNDDKNLRALFESNRVGAGKLAVNDKITLTVVYPDGSITTLEGGQCANFMPSPSGTSQGRLKTKIYQFNFENLGTS